MDVKVGSGALMPTFDQSMQLAQALGVEMLLSGCLASDCAEAAGKLQALLDNDLAADVFSRMVSAQKVPTDFVDRVEQSLPAALLSKAVYVERAGFVSAMGTRALGMAGGMGGGRRAAGDAIDYSVGLSETIRPGDYADEHRPLSVAELSDNRHIVLIDKIYAHRV